MYEVLNWLLECKFVVTGLLEMDLGTHFVSRRSWSSAGGNVMGSYVIQMPLFQ